MVLEGFDHLQQCPFEVCHEDLDLLVVCQVLLGVREVRVALVAPGVLVV